MNQQIKEELNARLNQLSGKQRKDILKQAAQLREQAQRKSKKPIGPVEEWIAKLLGVQTLGGGVAQVVRTGALECWARTETGETKRLHTVRGMQIVVGDRVVHDDQRVKEVLARTTKLVRNQGNESSSEVLVANVDQIVVVVSIGNPPLHPRIIDRYLVAIERGGATPIVCVNKVDSMEGPDRDRELEKVSPYREAGYAVYSVSAQSGEGIEDFRRPLQGRANVFVGHSGVGKSSLVNAVLGQTLAATGAVSVVYGRGRHTTTGTQWLDLPGGGCLIDTPGVREFGIELEAESGFPEFAEAAALCRFRDCRHLQEHDCGVKSAVREGTISRERYITYCRLLGTSADEQDDFQCVHCGQLVSGVAPGSRFRNHCPQCLWSRHVDTIPGDRGAACDGAMEPIAVWLRKGGEWCLIHRCDQCGVIHSNRVAGDDLDWALMSLAARPIANPPFSLTSMGA